MTSSGVSKLANILPLTKGSETGNVAQTSQSFDTFLNHKSEMNLQTEAAATIKKQENVAEPQVTYEKEKSESGYKDITKVESESKENLLTEEVKNEYEELTEEVTQALMEKLDVTEEEIVEAMNALGITFENLLQGKGLSELVMELKQTEDMTMLLFDDGFQDLVQEIDALVQNFAEEFGMTTEEFDNFIQQLQEKMNSEIQETESVISEQTILNNAKETVTKQPKAQEDMSTQEVVTENLEDVQKGELPEELMATKEVETDVLVDEMQKSEETQQNPMNQETDSQDGFLKNMEQKGEQDIFGTKKQTEDVQPQMNYQTSYHTTVSATGEEMVQVVERVFIDVEDIMGQITEFAKVTVEQSQSTIEMQLNPEHLGKVYLQVASQDGAITAKIAAENEAVKQALENQLIVLKENMNQQGIKVEAVEVTIATHEFEQNLQQDQQSPQERTEEGNKKSQRFISVEQLDQMAGLMTEEETLVAKMMLENGNSMDMTV